MRIDERKYLMFSPIGKEGAWLLKADEQLLRLQTDADNSCGSLPAACNDWRIGDADSMSARTTTESTPNAG
jgi:hypothetical protein